jgi:hypothetical protein
MSAYWDRMQRLRLSLLQISMNSVNDPAVHDRRLLIERPPDHTLLEVAIAPTKSNVTLKDPSPCSKNSRRLCGIAPSCSP